MNKAELKNVFKLIVAAGALALLFIPLKSLSQDLPARSFDPSPDWRPTHAVAAGGYVNDKACAECHSEAERQSATPMAHALATAAESRILQQHPQLNFKDGSYTYEITRQGEQSTYTVTDGKSSLSLPILYAFGHGQLAQTYLLKHEGKYYEGRVSFYTRPGKLDFTLGASPKVPASLTAALGRVLDTASLNDCFSCHATTAVAQGNLQLDRMTPGVTCQGCHGPGAKHIALMKTQRNATAPETQIFNPGRFDAEGLTQFCGACHRSWVQVQMLGIRGVENVRFQPYRIFNSKCYDHEDKRISCTACHDPHAEMVRDATFYDTKCQACHQTESKLNSAKKLPLCPVGKQNCASCHMPKTEIPGAHFQFTDHMIRVARPGEAYPN